MNYFEQELRRIADACDGITSPTFAGRACFADLGGDNRVKLMFVTLGYADRYAALKATVLNRTDGEVDSLLFRFSDIWGSKQVTNPNFREGVIPHITTNYINRKDSWDWYIYKPTDADMKKLAAEVGAYLAVFADRSRVPEKMRGQDSVIKTLREAKQNPSPRKDSQAQKKPGPDL